MIEVIASQAGQNFANATTLNLGQPDDSIPGDHLVAYVTWCGSTGLTIATPTGWTQIGTQQQIGTATFAAVFIRPVVTPGRYTSSTSHQFTASGGSPTYPLGLLLVVRGLDPTTPVDVSAVEGSVASGSSYTIPGVTPTTDGAAAIAFATVRNNDNGWTGVSGNGWGAVAGAANAQIGFRTRIQSAFHPPETPAGATGDATFAVNAAAGGAIYHTIALRPSSSPTAYDRHVRSAGAGAAWSSGFGNVTATPGLPPRTAIGDTVLIICRGALANFTTPSGWTAGPTIGTTYATFYRRVTSLPFTMPGWTFNPLSTPHRAVAVAFRDLDPNTPLGPVAARSGASSTSMASAGGDPTQRSVVALHLYAAGGSAPGLTAVDVGTHLASYHSSASTNLRIGLAYLDEIDNLPYTTATITGTQSSATTWDGFVLLLNTAPTIVNLSTSAEIGIAADVLEMTAAPGAQFLELAPVVDVSATVRLKSRRSRRIPARRELVWVYGLDGEQRGVIS